MIQKRTYLSLIILSIWGLSLKAQSDTTAMDSMYLNHSPKKAAILSAVIPGAGQIYNKKYWKVPIIYGAIAAGLYYAFDQRKQFKDYKSAYISRVDNDPSTVDSKYTGVYSNQNLLSLIEYHRRNRDLLFFVSGLTYALNIIDATVDAHLYYFDVSDELSVAIRPKINYNPYIQTYASGIQLNLRFHK